MLQGEKLRVKCYIGWNVTGRNVTGWNVSGWNVFPPTFRVKKTSIMNSAISRQIEVLYFFRNFRKISRKMDQNLSHFAKNKKCKTGTTLICSLFLKICDKNKVRKWILYLGLSETYIRLFAKRLLTSVSLNVTFKWFIGFLLLIMSVEKSNLCESCYQKTFLKIAHATKLCKRERLISFTQCMQKWSWHNQQKYISAKNRA